jgi:hypothetical protein
MTYYFLKLILSYRQYIFLWFLVARRGHCNDNNKLGGYCKIIAIKIRRHYKNESC